MSNFQFSFEETVANKRKQTAFGLFELFTIAFIKDNEKSFSVLQATFKQTR